MEQRLTIRFENDIGEPLAGERVILSQLIQTVGEKSSSSLLLGIPDAADALDATGRISLPARRSFHGVLSVHFSSEGLSGHARWAQYELEWDGAAGERTVVIPRLGSVAGKIVSSGPYHGIRYAISNARSGMYGGMHWPYPYDASQLAVDADGRFRIGGLSPGQFEITFLRGEALEAIAVEVKPCDVVDDLELNLDDGGGWILGRVVSPPGALKRERVVKVQALATALRRSREESMWLAIDATGAYRAGTLVPGLYRVTVHDWVPPTGDSRYLGHVLASDLVWCDGAGEAASTLAVGVGPLSITGSIDPGQETTEGLKVQIESADGESVGPAVAVLQGRFELVLDAPGRFELIVSGVQAGASLGPWRLPVTLESEDIGLALRVPSGCVEIGGLPGIDEAETWKVAVHSLDDGGREHTHSISPSTDGTAQGRASGKIRVGGLTTGRYTIHVTATGEGHFSETFDVVEGTTLRRQFADRQRAALVLPPPLAAAVKERKARVRVTTPMGTRYSGLGNLPAGPATVLVQSGAEASIVEVTLAPGEELLLDPQLQAGATIKVETCLDDRPVLIAVSVREASGLELRARRPTLYRPDHEVLPAKFHPLPAGTYSIVIEGHVWKTVTLVAGETVAVRVDL